MAAAAHDRAASPTPSQLPPVPASPTYSLASTTNPIAPYNLPLPPPPRPAHAVLTKSDLEQSHQAYSDLVATAKSYRLALAALSTAASTFGSALEACARLKEARAEAIGPSGLASMTASFTAGRGGSCTADLLLAASGVHHLVANHQQILSETVYRSFEVPLLHELDKWRAGVDDEEETYQSAVKSQSRDIRRLEKEGLKLHRQRRRDVGRFRAHLVELTTKLDGLTTLHADHARTLLRESQDTSAKILDASCSLVRAEVDIFESLARKGWSGGGLDDLLEKGVDLFAQDEGSHHGGGNSSGGSGGGGGGAGGDPAKLFSILPPKSILADSASVDSRPAQNRGDSLLAENDRYQSLAAVASAPDRTSGRRDGDADSVFSTDFNRPRGARPFSPQPIRRNPTDVTFDSLGAVGESSAAPAPADLGASKVAEEDDEDGHSRAVPDLASDDEDGHPWRDEGQQPGRNDSAENTPSQSSREERERGRRWSSTRDVD